VILVAGFLNQVLFIPSSSWLSIYKGLCFAVAAGRAGGMMRSACRVAGKKEARVSARAWFVVHDVGVGIDR
jgi:hypothetical protein